MEQATKLTQQQRVLKLLKSHLWWSGLDFARSSRPILCYTKRISELRAEGYDIEKRWNNKGFWEYRLKP